MKFFRRKGGKKKPTLAKLQRAVTGLKDLPEWKISRVASDAVNMTDTGSFIRLVSVAEGSSYNQRVGREIQLRHLWLRFRIQPQATTQTCRVIVYIDYGAVAGASSITNMTQLMENTVTVTQQTLSHYNSDYITLRQEKGHQKKCVVMYDSGPLYTPATVNNEDYTQFRNVDKPLRNKLQFNGTTAADAQRGCIFMAIYSDTGTAGNQPLLAYVANIAFCDP